MGNNIVVLNSQKGLVVIDTSGYPGLAKQIREFSEKEFKDKTFIYVINTHHHWDHIRGNQAFVDVPTIIHDNSMRVLLPRPLAVQSKNLAHLPPAGVSGPYKENKSPSIITFNDHLTLHLGDLTLRLVYFGRAHSPGDILIHVKEEGLLLTGDIFLDRNWLPLFSEEMILDIPRWIEVLNNVLDEKNRLSLVIPGHLDFWTPKKLSLWRDYIADLWQWVNQCLKNGIKIKEVIKDFPLKEKYLYLKQMGHSDAKIKEFHERNIQSFWTQLFESAANEVKKVLISAGRDAAIKKFHLLKFREDDRFIFNERQFNLAGYELLMQGKIDEAITIFKLNVEAFPDSWNVYDSLAEAYMVKGKKKLAIKYYKKSLTMNPKNHNAKRILQRLERE